MAAMPASAFHLGEIVNIPKYGGKAVILEGPADEPGTDRHGRYRVQYQEDGTCYWVNPSKIRRVNVATKRVVVAYRTAEYRQAAIHNTDRQDVCLEIGCHAGVTSFLLSKRCQGVIGIDTSAHVINVARSKYPHLRFEQLDGNDVEGAQQLASEAGLPPITKLMIDISGQAPLSLLLPLLKRWSEAIPGITIIVKNRALHCAVSVAERLRKQGLCEDQHNAVHKSAISHQAENTSAATCDKQRKGPHMVSQGLSIVEPGAAVLNDSSTEDIAALGNEISNMDSNSDDESNAHQDIDVDCVHSIDQTADLLLGDGHSTVDIGLKDLFVWVCDQCETFTYDAQQDFDAHYKTKALRRAAFVAQEISGKQARLQAKRERRAAKKLQVVDTSTIQ